MSTFVALIALAIIISCFSYELRCSKFLLNYRLQLSNPSKPTVSFRNIKIYMAKGDAVSRRKKRRGSETVESEDVLQNESNEIVSSTSEDKKAVQSDGTSSLEDLFGLGNNQLRELMEQELPVPREDLATRKEIKNENMDKNKVFKLPDLTEFVSDASKVSDAKKKKQALDSEIKIDRSNPDEYLRVIQLNPFADADDSMFEEEYDIIPSIFGSGKLLYIPVPYLQTGHGILLIVTLLSALVYAPGNPLTEFPPEIRTFLKQGLIITYSINVVLAIQSFFIAKSKNLPAFFWTIKTFLLGGIAFYEINQAKDFKDYKN